MLPISCLIVGFLIALVRPRDPLAWITLAMLASFGQIATLADVWTIHSPWREIFLVYHSLLSELWPLWVVLFGMYFPVPFRFVEKRRWLNWVLAIPFGALAALEVFGSLREGRHLETLTGLAAFEESISTAEVVLFAFCVVAFLGMLIAKQRGTDNRGRATPAHFDDCWMHARYCSYRCLRSNRSQCHPACSTVGRPSE